LVAMVTSQVGKVARHTCGLNVRHGTLKEAEGRS
jgi:hypothetical protein